MGAKQIDFTKHIFIDGLNYTIIRGVLRDYTAGYGSLILKDGSTQHISLNKAMEVEFNFGRLEKKYKIANGFEKEMEIKNPKLRSLLENLKEKSLYILET